MGKVRVIHLADSNHAETETVYYYFIITKQCIEKIISYIDYQKLFPYILSPANIRNESYD